jgi:hypothetical protein
VRSLGSGHLLYCILPNMPRKTRRQKEKTKERRSLGGIPDRTGTSTVKGEFEFSFSPEKLALSRSSKQERSDKSVRLESAGTTRRDLLKTVLLATVIFVLEFVIYSRWFK